MHGHGAGARTEGGGEIVTCILAPDVSMMFADVTSCL